MVSQIEVKPAARRSRRPILAARASAGGSSPGVPFARSASTAVGFGSSFCPGALFGSLGASDIGELLLLFGDPLDALRAAVDVESPVAHEPQQRHSGAAR